MASPDEGPGAPAPNRRLVALIPDDGQEPAAGVSEPAAAGVWAAISALWHPALLATATHLPEIENVDGPLAPEPGDVRVIAAGAADQLPSGYRARAEDAGALVVAGEADRA